MTTYTKLQKEAIIQALKLAHEKALAEQDHWRERFKVMEIKGAMDISDKLVELKWKGIHRLMKGATCPPSHQDRENFREQPWNEHPFYIKVSKISDEDIRHKTYFLNEIVEHRDRIRSVTQFLEALDAHPDSKQASRAYRLWQMYSMYDQLSLEAASVGEKDKAYNLMKLAKATAGFFDLLVGTSGKLDYKTDAGTNPFT